MKRSTHFTQFLASMEAIDPATGKPAWEGTANRLLRNGGWEFIGTKDAPLVEDMRTDLNMEESLLLMREAATFAGVTMFSDFSAFYAFENMYFLGYLREHAPDQVKAFLEMMPFRLMVTLALATGRDVHPVLQVEPAQLYPGTIVVKYTPDQLYAYHALMRDGDVQVSHELRVTLDETCARKVANILDIQPSSRVEQQYSVDDGRWTMHMTVLA